LPTFSRSGDGYQEMRVSLMRHSPAGSCRHFTVVRYLCQTASRVAPDTPGRHQACRSRPSDPAADTLRGTGQSGISRFPLRCHVDSGTNTSDALRSRFTSESRTRGSDVREPVSSRHQDVTMVLPLNLEVVRRSRIRSCAAFRASVSSLIEPPTRRGAGFCNASPPVRALRRSCLPSGTSRLATCPTELFCQRRRLQSSI
jgi:hypothetical protein